MSIRDFLESKNDRLNRQLLFTAEIDKMTDVLRQTVLISKSRRENDAEHSWHIAVMAMLFSEYAPVPVDIGRVVQMCVAHDLVEIEAGDTFAYDVSGNVGKAEREKEAADKLFSKLPKDQGCYIRALWEEFDAMETPDSKYAACMDRLQPFLHNTLTDGHTWGNGKVTRAAVEKRMAVIKDFMPEVYQWIEANIDQAVEKGWIAPSMTVRHSKEEDFERIMEIYGFARSFMAEHGNPTQWGPTHWPPEALIHNDIRDGNSYVCLNAEGKVIGTFFFIHGKDIEPTYREISEGAWLDDSPYGVVHRLAGDGSEKGIGAFCINWAYEQCGHLRIDTHGDNVVMQNLAKKLGFVHCGTIYVEEDDYPRLAYEKSKAIESGLRA